MANYPTMDVDVEGSEEAWRDPRLVSIARSGAVKVRALGTSKRKDFTLHHSRLTAVEKEALEVFYDANRVATFTWQHPLTGASYSVVFGQPDGLAFKLLKGNRYAVTVKLLGV